MERRDVLKYTAFFMGASLSSGTIAAILAGCKIEDTVDWEPVFLSTLEVQFISEIGETILPRTTTPGAKDAMVAKFIDTVRPLRYSKEDNDAFKLNLSRFMDQSSKELGTDFIKASEAKKLEWVTAVDKESYEAIKGRDELPDD